MNDVALAVDVGGTSFKGALVDAAGRSVHAVARRPDGRVGEPAFAELLLLCDELRDAARSGGWRDLPLRDRLQARLDLPVATGHDVRTAGLAEGLFGAGRGTRHFAFVMVGTGIAAALACDGTIVAGARNLGGEFGHMPVHPGGEPCACGQVGCLETYASAAAIARRYRARGGGAPLTAAEVGLAQAQDPVARAVWTEAVEALSIGLATLTMLLDPDVFILGGGLAEAGPLLLDPLAAALERRLAWRSAPTLRRSLLGREAGLLGAALLAYQAAGQQDVTERWRHP